LVHWAVRFADSLDLDEVERTYKLEIAERVRAAADAVRANDAQWPRLLRRAFSPPNNLTAWRMHGTFLTWVNGNVDAARSLLLALWDPDRDVHSAVNAFCALLPSVVSGGGTQANLASFLLAARDITRYPVFRVTAFNTAYRLTGWSQERDGQPADRYDEAVAFLDEFAAQCRVRGATGLRNHSSSEALPRTV
jgi:hypothetical protein